MSAPANQPSVSMSAVLAAGLASATAAVVTSRFGVAGTLIGAALTTMIITGGSAILKAYLESVSGKVRRVPGKVRERAVRSREPRDLEGPNPPGRPDLSNNFMGRLRAALDWFSNLSLPRKRYILSAALIPMALAFIIGIGAVTGVELASGRSLSCSVWNQCPMAADGTSVGTRPSLLGAGAKSDTPEQLQDQQQVVDPAQNQQVPSDSGVQPAQPANPQQETPSDSATPDPGTPDQEPVPSEDPIVEEAPPEEQTPEDSPSDPSGGGDNQEPTPSEP